MSGYIKRCRENAGLTQEQLADKMEVSTVAVQNWENGRTAIRQDKYIKLSEIFNVPVEDLIKEMLIEADKSRPDQWPGFLFDDSTNSIIDSLHLNLAQQDLFGLLYIYGAEYLKETEIMDWNDCFDKDLRRIPYGFIDRIGSIRFMNQAHGLHDVLRYVKPDFLLKVLRLNPDSEFNVKKLSKELICEFIDDGHKEISSNSDDPDLDCKHDVLELRINMRKAKILLPVLEKFGPVHLTDRNRSYPIREDIPEELSDAIQEACDPYYDRHVIYLEGKKYIVPSVHTGLEAVTDYLPTDKDGKESWILSIKGKGRELLKWLNE